MLSLSKHPVVAFMTVFFLGSSAMAVPATKAACLTTAAKAEHALRAASEADLLARVDHSGIDILPPHLREKARKTGVERARADFLGLISDAQKDYCHGLPEMKGLANGAFQPVVGLGDFTHADLLE